MYQVGALIVYGAEGVCRVESVGPLEMRGVQKGTSYYALAPCSGRERSSRRWIPRSIPERS